MCVCSCKCVFVCLYAVLLTNILILALLYSRKLYTANGFKMEKFITLQLKKNLMLFLISSSLQLLEIQITLFYNFPKQ